jgi:cysteine-S-conjugate beta-lyase
MQDAITGLIHHPYTPPEGFHAPQPGVFKASTVIFPNVAAMRSREWKDKTGYTYGLHGTPTTYILEERLATLEGGLQCLLVPSGLAAIATVALAMLKTGDEILIPDNAYGPGTALAEAELKAWGITHRYYDAMNPQDLRDKVSAKTRLVWVEAAGSVTMEFPDLCELVRICKAKHVLCALDNTWGAGIAFKPFDLTPGASANLGVDISVHALTKYPSGGGDVLMGSVVTRDAGLHLKIKLTHMRLGLGVAGNDAELVLRALPSIVLRYQAHDIAARQLATWCQSRPEFAQVLHPALAGSPGHVHWQALCNAVAAGNASIAGIADQVGSAGNVGSAESAANSGNAAGLFSVIFKAAFTQNQVDAFCDALKLFKLGFSWGGPMSLVVPYDLASMRVAWPQHLSRGTLVRFSIGLEAVPDLQADLAQALDAMAASR